MKPLYPFPLDLMIIPMHVGKALAGSSKPALSSHAPTSRNPYARQTVTYFFALPGLEL